MYKSAVNAFGELEQTVNAVSNVMQITPEAFIVLQQLIGNTGNDHTYMLVGIRPYAEIVKVTATGVSFGTIIVMRAQEGTTANTFTAGSPIENIFGAAAMTDIANQLLGTTVVLNPQGAVSIETLGNNEFNIGVVAPTFVSDDKSVIVTGQFPTYNIAVDNTAKGCCS